MKRVLRVRHCEGPSQGEDPKVVLKKLKMKETLHNEETRMLSEWVMSSKYPEQMLNCLHQRLSPVNLQQLLSHLITIVKPQYDEHILEKLIQKDKLCNEEMFKLARTTRASKHPQHVLMCLRRLLSFKDYSTTLKYISKISKLNPKHS